MSDLIIPTNPVGSKPTPTNLDAAKIRQVAERVLNKHKDDLPREIITMLRSPFTRIMQQGLEDAKPIVAAIVAAKRKELIENSPVHKEVRDLLARANFVLTGEHGLTILDLTDTWAKEIIHTDEITIVTGKPGLLKQLRDAVKWMERTERRLISDDRDAKAGERKHRSTRGANMANYMGIATAPMDVKGKSSARAAQKAKARARTVNSPRPQGQRGQQPAKGRRAS